MQVLTQDNLYTSKLGAYARRYAQDQIEKLDHYAVDLVEQNQDGFLLRIEDHLYVIHHDAIYDRLFERDEVVVLDVSVEDYIDATKQVPRSPYDLWLLKERGVHEENVIKEAFWQELFIRKYCKLVGKTYQHRIQKL